VHLTLQYSALITTLHESKLSTWTPLCTDHHSAQITTLHWTPLCTEHRAALQHISIYWSPFHHSTVFHWKTPRLFVTDSFYFCSLHATAVLHAGAYSTWPTGFLVLTWPVSDCTLFFASVAPERSVYSWFPLSLSPSPPPPGPSLRPDPVQCCQHSPRVFCQLDRKKVLAQVNKFYRSTKCYTMCATNDILDFYLSLSPKTKGRIKI
jgi:hypothetical protein